MLDDTVLELIAPTYPSLDDPEATEGTHAAEYTLADADAVWMESAR